VNGLPLPYFPAPIMKA